MASQVKVLAAQLEDLRLILGTHAEVERERTDSTKLSSDFYMHTVTCATVLYSAKLNIFQRNRVMIITHWKYFSSKGGSK